ESKGEIWVRSGQGKLLDDDAALSIDDVSKVEGDSGTADAVFTVSIPFASALAVTVHFATADGTATAADNDYQPTSGDLTFNPGDTSKTITVAVKGDTTPEASETFFVNLSNPSNASLARASGTGTSLSHDGATHFAVSAPASTTAGSAFTFTVTALDQLNNPATSYTGTVHFTSSDGQAVMPADTTLTNGTGSFSATLKTAGSQTL